MSSSTHRPAAAGSSSTHRPAASSSSSTHRPAASSSSSVQGSEYTTPTTPIWNLGQSTPNNTPYRITTPTFKLFHTDLLDLSRSLQQLAAAHTARGAPRPATTGGHNTPENTYLLGRRTTLENQLTRFPPTSGTAAAERAELEGYLQAIANFQRRSLPLHLVAQPHTMVLAFLRADLKCLLLALGVLKGDYARLGAAGEHHFMQAVDDFRYLKERLGNISFALRAVTKSATESADRAALGECERVRGDYQSAKELKSDIDRWVTKRMVKKVFSGNPRAS